MVKDRRAMGILTAIVLAGCASSRPAGAVDQRLDISAIARALATELPRGRLTIRLDAAELLSGRSRCGTDHRLRCLEPNEHGALVHALSRELNVEIVSYSEAMFCPRKRLPCIPRGEIALVKVALPVVDSSGITQVDVSSSLAIDESVHPRIFRVLLKCAAGQCAVVGRQRILTG